MEILQHFSHNHPLTLCEEGKDDRDEEVLCFGCSKSISGTTYSCSQCKFFLHKICAELPKKIISFLHPIHPLTLLAANPYEGLITLNDNDPYIVHCVHCEDDIIWGFNYHCSVCHIVVDIKCILLQKIIEPETHEHSFMALRPTEFGCDACGMMNDGISYLCTTCQLRVHKTCSSLPLTVKQVGHSHQLKLTCSFPLNLEDLEREYVCNICKLNVLKEFYFYNCEKCNYIAHVLCATRDDLRDEAFGIEIEKQVHIPSALISFSEETNLGLVAQGVKNVSLIGENHTVPKLQHFSQQHCLTLVNIEPKSDEICDGCARPISIPFYSCDQCNFLLHKVCAELPHTILHTLHEHPLTLQAKAPSNSGLFLCYGCEVACNGFTYTCEDCNMFFDVSCCLSQDTLGHKGHDQHTLTLVSSVFFNKCNACESLCMNKFKCQACNFHLHLQCASFPYTAKHECHKHNMDIRPLHLTFKSIDYEIGEYFCDICEEPRHQHSWFYHCEDCDYCAHPKCSIGKYLIKFGNTYQLDNHPHPLTLIDKCKGYYSRATSDDAYEQLALVCVKCNFMINPEPMYFSALMQNHSIPLEPSPPPHHGKGHMRG